MSQRQITLCADDYGISPAVSDAIRELLGLGRINATSVMVVAPSFSQGEADALVKAAGRGAIGLHITLTAPFRALSSGFAPLRNGAFLPLSEMALRSHLRLLKPARIAAEVADQFEAFRRAFGRPPDFVDGHQHVQIFPQIREAFLRVAKAAAPDAWVRQCERPRGSGRFTDLKALVLDHHSSHFRRLAERSGIRTNPAFAGTYAFRQDADFAALFPAFLEGMPDGGLIMCHPGKVDTELQRLDPLTNLREQEFAYFRGEAFARLLGERGIAL